jgi:hypothetical protein
MDNDTPKVQTSVSGSAIRRAPERFPQTRGNLSAGAWHLTVKTIGRPQLVDPVKSTAHQDPIETQKCFTVRVTELASLSTQRADRASALRATE